MEVSPTLGLGASYLLEVALSTEGRASSEGNDRRLLIPTSYPYVGRSVPHPQEALRPRPSQRSVMINNASPPARLYAFPQTTP